MLSTSLWKPTVVDLMFMVESVTQNLKFMVQCQTESIMLKSPRKQKVDIVRKHRFLRKANLTITPLKHTTQLVKVPKLMTQ